MPGPWRDGYVREEDGPGPWRVPEAGDEPALSDSGLPTPGPLLDRAAQALSGMREAESTLETAAMAATRLVTGEDKYTALERELARLRAAPDSATTRRQALSLLRSVGAIRPEDLVAPDQKMIGLSDAGDAGARARENTYARAVAETATELADAAKQKVASAVPWGAIFGGLAAVGTVVTAVVAVHALAHEDARDRDRKRRR